MKNGSFVLKGLLGKVHAEIEPGFHDLWGLSKSLFKIKISRETFGSFSTEQLFFARALVLASLSLVFC